MDSQLRSKLVSITRKIVKNDISHSFDHIYRVLTLAEKIGRTEGADLDVVVPAALFHDIVVYKGTASQKIETEESAKMAKKILGKINQYPKEKIKQVRYAISVCSFSKNIKPKTLEARVVQDADLLEATGAISIMRTFGSSVAMGNRQFFDVKDPFAASRMPNDHRYSPDLFFTRLLIAKDRMHTKAARKIAHRRTAFLRSFLKELRIELRESE